LEIHPEPERPDKKTGHPCRHILGNLSPLLGSKLLELLVVGLDLGFDCCAVHETVLRLNDCDRLRRSTGTSAQPGG
jgi:hypothetical protein